jgi:hypothetical protein
LCCYTEGVPARASKINTETEFALENWGAELPVPVAGLYELKAAWFQP